MSADADTFKDLDALRKISLGASPTGTPILLDNVAKISFGPDIRRGVGELDGTGEAVGGIVIMRFGENALGCHPASQAEDSRGQTIISRGG